MEEISLQDPIVAAAFNEWMRRYIQHPEQFQREWQTIVEFQKKRADGAEPDYGASAVAYLAKLISEIE